MKKFSFGDQVKGKNILIAIYLGIIADKARQTSYHIVSCGNTTLTELLADDEIELVAKASFTPVPRFKAGQYAIDQNTQPITVLILKERNEHQEYLCYDTSMMQNRLIAEKYLRNVEE